MVVKIAAVAMPGAVLVVVVVVAMVRPTRTCSWRLQFTLSALDTNRPTRTTQQGKDYSQFTLVTVLSLCACVSLSLSLLLTAFGQYGTNSQGKICFPKSALTQTSTYSMSVWRTHEVDMHTNCFAMKGVCASSQMPNDSLA